VGEAHRRRVLEIYYDNKIDPDHAEALAAVKHHHHGVVAPRYLQAVAILRDKIPLMLEQATQIVQGWGEIPQANRFAIWTLASALVGGRIARAAGLIDYDVEGVVKHVAQIEQRMAATVRTDAERFPEALANMVSDKWDNFSKWRAGTDGITAQGLVRDVCVGRIDLDGGVIWVSKRSLDMYMEAEGMSLRNLHKLFKSRHVGVKSYRLRPGAPPVRSYEFTAHQFGLDLEAMKPMREGEE